MLFLLFVIDYIVTYSMFKWQRRINKYVLPEMDKNFQRYLASNTPKIGFFKIMAGRKEAGSN